MISVKNLNIKFKEKTVIKGGVFSIEAGDHLQILGPSGSGKSTVLKSLIKFIPGESSDVVFNGRVLESDWISEYRSHFTYIGQKAPFFDGSVADFLKLPFLFNQNKGHAIPKDNEVASLLESLGFVESPLTQLFNSLSGGEQQRIAIAQALLLKRKIYLLDEVTSSLDPGNTQLVIDLFKALSEVTLVIVSHDLEWKAVATRSLEITNRNIVEVTK